MFHYICYIYFILYEYTLCAVIDCGDPPSPNNASPASAILATIFGITVTYQCDVGFVRVEGDSTITCEESGNWSGQGPICEGT